MKATVLFFFASAVASVMGMRGGSVLSGAYRKHVFKFLPRKTRAQNVPFSQEGDAAHKALSEYDRHLLLETLQQRGAPSSLTPRQLQSLQESLYHRGPTARANKQQHEAGTRGEGGRSKPGTRTPRESLHVVGTVMPGAPLPLAQSLVSTSPGFVWQAP